MDLLFTVVFLQQLAHFVKISSECFLLLGSRSIEQLVGIIRDFEPRLEVVVLLTLYRVLGGLDAELAIQKLGDSHLEMTEQALCGSLSDVLVLLEDLGASDCLEAAHCGLSRSVAR